MSDPWTGRGREDRAAPEVVDLVGVLDPGFEDGEYWRRMRLRIMSAAAPELARRRAEHATVFEVVEGWARMLVPAAALAAGLAALILLRDGAPATRPLAVDEFLLSGIEEPVLSELASPSGAEGAVFASEVRF
ncbi:MAG: hypothetical protein D6701_12290 [Gemmatimonadetes bacterium]|nr:MAG: hypothetical protein D6701_12290 [Gemmatimonadota bacterium]